MFKALILVAVLAAAYIAYKKYFAKAEAAVVAKVDSVEAQVTAVESKVSADVAEVKGDVAQIKL